MHSMDGETVPFSESLYPTGNVEDWLLEVERVMRQSILESVRLSVEAYPDVRGCFNHYSIAYRTTIFVNLAKA